MRVMPCVGAMIFLMLAATGHAQGTADTVRFRMFLRAAPSGWALQWRDASEPGTVRFKQEYSVFGMPRALSGTLVYGPAGGSVPRLSFFGHLSGTIVNALDVAIEGDSAVVASGPRRERSVVRPAAFPSPHYPPIAVLDALTRHWLASGRPAELVLAPAGRAQLRRTAVDTLDIAGVRSILEVVTLRGPMWGVQVLWLDAAGSLFTWVGGNAELDAVQVIRSGATDSVRWFIRRAQEIVLAELESETRGTIEAMDGPLAIVGAAVFDGVRDTLLPDHTVIVDGNRIVAVGPSARVKAPVGARVVEARGKHLIPGLWDAHVHLAQPEWTVAALAAGVTTVRDMGGEPEFIARLAATIEGGGLPGAAVIAAGRIDGNGYNQSVATAQEARDSVAAHARRGATYIKIYEHTDTALVRVIVEEARRHGMRTVGHVPSGMTLAGFLAAGVDEVTHWAFALRGIRPAALNDSAAARTRLFTRSGERPVAVDPTLARLEWMSFNTDSGYAVRDSTVLLAPPALQWVLAHAGNAAATAARADSGFRNVLRAAGAFHRAGGILLAGSDQVLPGYALHRELELLVRAGLSPAAALRAATSVPATQMTGSSRAGRIVADGPADLVLLHASPLSDIRNSRRIALVVSGGRLFKPEPLWHAVGFTTPDSR